MRTKVTLVLIFLNVALFFFIFKFERNWRTEAASQEARRRVLGPEAADIRTLEVIGPNGAPVYSLVRRRDTWFLTRPLEWPANPLAVSSLVLELSQLEHEASFSVADAQKNGQSLADFGLAKPKLTVVFSSGDPATAGGTPLAPTHLLIGDTTKDGKRLYILSPEGDRVHVVNRSLVDRLSVPLEQLRADTLLSIRVFEARSLLLVPTTVATEPGRTSADIRIRIRRDGTRWTFDAPITARASKTAIELALNELNGLRAKSFPPAPSTPLPSLAHTLRITIEGNNRSETLFVGDPVPAATATSAANATSSEYYAQLEGRNALFTVVIPPALMERLRNAQETLREKRILDFDPAAVTAIELAAPVQPNQAPVTLRRLEPPPGQAAGAAPPWQIARRGDATDGPQTLPADRGAVQRLLDRLSLLSAERFKSDAPTSADLEEWGFNRPAREITLTLAGNTAPIILRIGTAASRDVAYARVATANDPGNSIYQIRPDILDELPLAPIAWRDRAVIEPLPPTARITALKLTDLLEKKVLFETTFNANGEPATPPRDPKAVQDVVLALRTLRAKEYVPGGYTEKVAAAGDDRPWRFQLEATIAQPAAGGPERTNNLNLSLTERLGGAQQYAGIKELDTVFALEQPLVDALWSLAYGARDPGAPAERKN